MKSKLVENIINKAFNRAEKNAKSVTVKENSNKIRLYRKKNYVRFETIRNIVVGKIDSICSKVPYEDSLSDFYKELINIHTSWKKIKNSRIRLNYVKSFIDNLLNEYKKKVKRCKNIDELAKIRKEFYGRISSILRKNSEHFETLYSVQEFIRKLPKVKNCPTIVLAGYPNVGKSTLLKKITNSPVEIQNYPFTTKDIKIGYLRTPYFDIQIIDTPGILDRPLESLNDIEKKAILSLKYLANMILFVIDITETCGYPLKDQLKLLENIKKKFRKTTFIYLSKKDLFEDSHKKIEEELKKRYPHVFSDVEDLKENLIEFIKKKKEWWLNG